MNIDINFSINNTAAVYAALQEMGRPDFAELMLDISERCAQLLRHFEDEVNTRV